MIEHIVRRIVRFIVLAVLFVVFCIAVLALAGFVVMSLWNWLMPLLFGLKSITFWQAVGLIILCKLLFGGFRGARGGRRHGRLGIKERWEKMTPEEREKFREGLHGRWGRVEPPDPKPST